MAQVENSTDQVSGSAAQAAPTFTDDRSPHCIPFILEQYNEHKARYSQASGGTPAPPLIVGLNGIQGAGKTTVVKSLATTLRSAHGVEVLVVSIDDFYLPHDAQVELAQANRENPLVQHRGEPGTHDVPLLEEFMQSILSNQPTRVPQYDKSAFNGQGDRVPATQWASVNSPSAPVQLVILEGWCVGFRALSPAEVEAKVAASSANKDASVLWKHRLEDLLFVNEQLRHYDVVTDKLQALIHIDAEDTRFVYSWRLEQEAMLRHEKGSGMTDEQVVKFVDGYYPAYELYTEGLRKGAIKGESSQGRQLTLVVGQDRKVVKVSRV